MKYNIKSLTALLAAALLSANVQAKGLEYSYAEIGYFNTDSDTAEGDGFKVALSFAAHDYVHIRASFASLEMDKVAGVTQDMDVDEFTIGFGGNYSVLDNVDLVGGVVYLTNEGTGPVKADEEGYVADLGVRAQLMKKFEVNAGYLNQELGNQTDDGFFVGAVADISKKFAVSLRAEDKGDDDQTNYFVGLRLNF